MNAPHNPIPRTYRRRDRPGQRLIYELLGTSLILPLVLTGKDEGNLKAWTRLVDSGIDILFFMPLLILLFLGWLLLGWIGVKFIARERRWRRPYIRIQSDTVHWRGLWGRSKQVPIDQLHLREFNSSTGLPVFDTKEGEFSLPADLYHIQALHRRLVPVPSPPWLTESYIMRERSFTGLGYTNPRFFFTWMRVSIAITFLDILFQWQIWPVSLALSFLVSFIICMSHSVKSEFGMLTVEHYWGLYHRKVDLFDIVGVVRQDRFLGDVILDTTTGHIIIPRTLPKLNTLISFLNEVGLYNDTVKQPCLLNMESSKEDYSSDANKVESGV